MKWLIGVAAVYAALCIGALLLIPVSAHGWFGVSDDPLAGVFALLLALPWTLLLQHFDNLGFFGSLAIIVLGMGLNVGIVLTIGHAASQRRK
ncbi:hypothetical protein [Novosphingobium sp.]|uniref:SCO4225 family membrane protein n=1 Tax=Novosphingobium sp. TaxID=1874826 RepID=UPI0028AE9A70|nr:hypothetical protein [Novosphingobium sp.]